MPAADRRPPDRGARGQVWGHSRGRGGCTEALERFFTEGWNRHDLDRLMTFMADDCVFESATGAEVCGTRHAGRERVPRGVRARLRYLPRRRVPREAHVVAGERGLSEWRFTGTRADGTCVEVNGCDVFTFRGDKITVKSSFFKNRSA